MSSQASQCRQGGQDMQFKPVFNQEELRVLKECNRESFYFRSVPLAAALSTATYLAMHRGILRPSARFGYTPKILGSIALGYFFGKFSYQNACAEKLMQLPNSPIGDALRKRKGRMGFQETLGMETGFTLSPAPSEGTEAGPAEPIFDDYRPDLRDHNEGLEEYHRGVTDSLSPYTEPSAGPPPSPTTYQELRRQNRDEYAHKMAEKYRRPVQGDSQLDIPPPSPSSPYSSPDQSPSSFRPTSPLTPSLSPPVRKNQYGDDVYE